MAKIVSPVWSSIRGSIAGTTYLTTSSGAIIGRQRVKPAQPISNYRTLIKDGLAFSAAQWTQMTSSNRSRWNSWALAHSTKTGRQEFCGGQAFEYYFGNLAPTGWPSPLVADFNAPGLPNLPSITVTGATPTTPGITGCAVSVTNQGQGEIAVIVEVSAGYSVARNYVKGPWVPALTVADTLGHLANATIEVPGLVAGLKYFMRVRALNIDTTPGLTGRVVTTPWIVSNIAVTVP